MPSEALGYLASLRPPNWLAPLLPADLTPKQRAAIAARLLWFPLPPTAVTFTRPMYPYPLHAHYVGGDRDKAESFR